MRTIVRAAAAAAAVSALAPGPVQGSTQAIVLRGTTSFMGTDATFEYVIEPFGAFKRTISGPLPDAYSESGTAAWATDWTGMPRTLVSREREWNQVFTAVLTGSWTSPASRLSVKAVGSDGNTFEISHPDGPTKATLEVDAETGAARKLRYFSFGGVVEWAFDGEVEKAGVRFPKRIVQTIGETVDTFEVESIELRAAGNARDYAELPQRPADATFADDAPRTIEFRRASTGHLLVKPLVNGKEIGWFIFDTGAGGSTSINRATVDELDLDPLGRTLVLSIMGPAVSPVLRASTLQLGPLTIEHPTIIAWDMGALSQHFDVPVIGVIGYDVLSRCVAELDLEGNTLTLEDPATYDGKALEWKTLHLIDRHPVIPARFEGRDGLFKMDVGAAPGPLGNVTFHSPAVASMKLLDGREVRTMDIGVGKVGIGKLEWFELNGQRFESPDVAFAQPGPGPFADAYTTGNIGVRFLAAFRIVFDYTRDRVAFAE